MDSSCIEGTRGKVMQHSRNNQIILKIQFILVSHRQSVVAVICGDTKLSIVIRFTVCFCGLSNRDLAILSSSLFQPKK